MKFSTTIKRKYWKEKLESVKEKGYFYEYKADTPFWHKRLSKLRDNLPAEGVFLVGSKVKKVVITEILRSLACYIPEKYESMFNTEYVWVLKCWLVGEENDKEEARESGYHGVVQSTRPHLWWGCIETSTKGKGKRKGSSIIIAAEDILPVLSEAAKWRWERENDK